MAQGKIQTIKIEKAEKDEKRKKRELKKMGNPVWGILWRFFICCAIIDLAIIGYFNLIKGVPTLVGIEQAIEKLREVERQEPIMEEAEQETWNTKYALFSWKGESGYREYSNVGFPTDRPYSEEKVDYFYK